ncbi:MAG: pyridoxal 5'-phosphate synthase glutaminase subunit PdxT [Deltaproteobacteria bacterium]|nr:pyridoxal 5'-phosphate synthase glutaminase subunit PdxT [Deltaproteobacteria bacterium]
MPIGILALQGAVELHHHKLRTIGVETVSVRTAEELRTCQGLIIPGGESTTFLKLIHENNLREPILAFTKRQPVWGVCAGSILMAKKVENPSQESFGFVPIRVRRNAYGRQNESFIAVFALNLPGRPSLPQEGVFIRAPQVVEWEDEVAVLAKHEDKPVALQYRQHLITTFHPELSESLALHKYFFSLCTADG